jgi:hypothetical protein
MRQSFILHAGSLIRACPWQSTSLLLLVVLCCAPVTLLAHAKSSRETYGLGLSIRVPATEPELLQAVHDVVSDGVIQGSKEYNKDEYIAGAKAADKTSVFPKWIGPGQVFYKLRENALDPRNFKDGGDSGTLAVRYVVEHGDDKNTILKIDAIFVDDSHLRPHLSDGSVEAAEFREIQDHLAAMHLAKERAVEDEKRHQQELAAKELERKHKDQQLELAVAQKPDETLEQHVYNLRREVERVVKTRGAQLKSAPFRSASSLKPLSAGSKVVILISTPYWFGVETEDGQHGWIHHSELEQLP